MNDHAFFGVILHDLKFVFSTSIDTFSTDGTTFYFNPYYLNDLSDKEVDICILHCLMHIALKHHLRHPNLKRDKLMHRACDIVANSNLMSSFNNGMQELVVQGKTLVHTSPRGTEGYLMSVEEVYVELAKTAQKAEKSKKSINNSDDFDDVSIDSFKATNLPRGTVKAFTLNADVSKKMYLKQLVFNNYVMDEDDVDWEVDDKIPLFDIDRFTYENVLSYPSHTEINTKLKFSNKMIGEQVPVPIYSQDNHLLGALIDDEQEIDFKSLSFKFNREAYAYFTSHPNNKDVDYIKELPPYLYLPDKIRKHFDSVNKRLGFKKNTQDLIFKIRDYIATTFDYDIKYPKSPKGMDPILYFAEISKSGKCTHFATYMTLMLRYYGIPARFVVGYMTPSLADEEIDVYKENAHAWVEAYVSNLGWATVDPTPLILQVGAGSGLNGNKSDGDGLDSHKMWQDASKNGESRLHEDELNKKLMEAFELSKSMKAGHVPASIELLLKELKETKIDWRILLDEFIQTEVNDYSFTIPDNRFSYTDFILPSFSEKDERVEKILFMVDVSGSMNDDQVSECFNEINGSLIQFNGKIEGHIGFFDEIVHDVVPFDQETNVLDIKPVGRGGTNFINVFKYIEDKMKDDLPVKIIILSDGYADFPDEEMAMGIPVLWIINNEEVTPPWGKVVRLT